jgi:hypothetical protein
MDKVQKYNSFNTQQNVLNRKHSSRPFPIKSFYFRSLVKQLRLLKIISFIHTVFSRDRRNFIKIRGFRSIRVNLSSGFTVYF